MYSRTLYYLSPTHNPRHAISYLRNGKSVGRTSWVNVKNVQTNERETLRCLCTIASKDSAKPKPRWKEPKGYKTPIQIYNHILKKNVPLVLRHDKLLTWYMCGPTVYSDTHIGHGSSYVKFDIIRRILIKFFSIDIVMCMGITDIDDKIIQKSRELNMDFKTLTRKYEAEFFTEMSNLRVLPPTVASRVTEHIPEIVKFVGRIIQNGCAYVTNEGSVYFDVAKYGKYGKLAQREFSSETWEMTDKLKQDHRDFALWKATKPGEPWWESPWGRGRPGWHIECSTMASTILGENIDIHSGGIDLLFPHHENEEAQCGACLGTDQWVNYWVHTGHLYLKGNEAKMSKSLKNYITLPEFMKKYNSNQFRLLCLMSNYKNGIEYSDSVMDQAVVIDKKLESFLTSAEAYIDGHIVCDAVDEADLMRCLAETKVNVQDALANDFDTAGAVKQILSLIVVANKIFQTKPSGNIQVTRSSGVIAACYSYIERILSIMGLKFPGRKTILMSSELSFSNLPQVLDSVVKFRSKVREHALKTGKDSLSKTSPQASLSAVDAKDVKDASKGKLPNLPDDPPESKGNISWTTKAPAVPKVPTSVRKEQDPLLQACDEFRNEILFSGIQIKDHGKGTASWSIHSNQTLRGVKSSLSNQDPYEPVYEPKTRQEGDQDFNEKGKDS